MDTESIKELVSDLTGSVDDLETALSPLLASALSTSASKLPLLDKAKLYVLATYSIESILFSYLRLNNVDAKSHPVFQELARVREYFGKIKKAENPHEGRGRLDKDAAGRFIKHGLSGNDRYDRERQAQGERDRAGAKRKFDGIAVGTHTRFDGAARKIKAAEEEHVGVVKASDVDVSEGEGNEEGGQSLQQETRDGRDEPLDNPSDAKHKKSRKTKKNKKRSKMEPEG